MRISDWSPDVCSSYLRPPGPLLLCLWIKMVGLSSLGGGRLQPESSFPARWKPAFSAVIQESGFLPAQGRRIRSSGRSEEHTSELQSLMRISYAVFCLKKQINIITYN